MGGGEAAICGALHLCCFPHPRNLTENRDPRVGTFGFLHGRMGPSHIVPCARLCAGHLGIEVAQLKP